MIIWQITVLVSTFLIRSRLLCRAPKNCGLSFEIFKSNIANSSIEFTHKVACNKWSKYYWSNWTYIKSVCSDHFSNVLLTLVASPCRITGSLWSNRSLGDHQEDEIEKEGEERQKRRKNIRMSRRRSEHYNSL